MGRRRRTRDRGVITDRGYRGRWCTRKRADIPRAPRPVSSWKQEILLSEPLLSPFISFFGLLMSLSEQHVASLYAICTSSLINVSSDPSIGLDCL